MFQSLADLVLITQEVGPISSASATAVVGGGVDMTGWEGVLFVLNIGLIASPGTVDMKAQSASAANFASPHDVAGAALVQVAAAGQSKQYAVDVKVQTMLAAQSADRYMRVVVPMNGSNAALVSVTAIRYRRNGSLPPTQALTQLVQV